MPVLFKCDECGKTELAREFQEASMKPMWVEPLVWLRRFDKHGRVVAVTCSPECDRAIEKGIKRKPGT